MSADSALHASPQLAKGSQQGVCALDYRAMTPEPVVAFTATPSNTRPDAQLAQVGAATGKVITIVCVQLV